MDIAMEALGDLQGLLSKTIQTFEYDQFSPDEPRMLPVMANDDGRDDDDDEMIIIIIMII